MSNKNVQLVLVEKRCCTFYHPYSNLSSSKWRLLRVAWILTSDWIKLCGSHAIHRSYVTSCKTSLPWAAKTRSMYRFCCKKWTTLYFLQQLFATCNNLICCKTGWMRVVKRAASLFNSFCSNIAKQVARFCCPFYRTLKQEAHIHQPTALPVPHACAQPYRPGRSSHGQLFRPYWSSSACTPFLVSGTL